MPKIEFIETATIEHADRRETIKVGTIMEVNEATAARWERRKKAQRIDQFVAPQSVQVAPPAPVPPSPPAPPTPEEMIEASRQFSAGSMPAQNPVPPVPPAPEGDKPKRGRPSNKPAGEGSDPLAQ